MGFFKKLFKPTPQPPTAEPGFYHGRHYTEHVEAVKQLKRERKYDDAEQLLLGLCSAVEAELAAERAKKILTGAAPWYYEQLAIIYRQLHRYADEVNILEHYNRLPRHPQQTDSAFVDRLEKARTLLAKQSE